MSERRLRRTIYTLIFLMSCHHLFAQDVFINNGQNIIFSDNVLFIVKNGNLINDDGLLQNEGHIHIEGDFINNSQAFGGNSNSDFFIRNDWENNSDFNANQSTVYLNGANQTIKGIEESHFYNLTLENGNVKALEINSEVIGLLNLKTSELATQENKMLVSNPNSNAVEFIDNVGFVSSLDNGRFVRNSNSTDSYIFPTGENIGTIKYRPIRIQPNEASSNQFELRFVNANADYDGYDFNQKNSSIKNLNENYYHFINQSIGNTESKLSIFYNPVEDGEWESIAQWDDWWKDFNNTNLNDYGSFKEVSSNNWLANNNEPHILINAGEECHLAVPTGFSPNSSGTNDYFKAIKTCDFSSFEMNVFDRWGELVFTTTDINNFWDGSYKGYKAELGVYTWSIKYTVDENEKHEEGTISLLR